MRKLKDPNEIRAHEKVIQFPFATPTTEEKTEEELARIQERRREQGRKLQELAAKAREEKVCMLIIEERCLNLYAGSGILLARNDSEQSRPPITEERWVSS